MERGNKERGNKERGNELRRCGRGRQVAAFAGTRKDGNYWSLSAKADMRRFAHSVGIYSHALHAHAPCT